MYVSRTSACVALTFLLVHCQRRLDMLLVLPNLITLDCIILIAIVFHVILNRLNTKNGNGREEWDRLDN